MAKRPSGPRGPDMRLPGNRKEDDTRINREINVPTVRMVGDNVENGLMPTQQALAIAQSLNLDLVEIAAQANPPVCRIIDYHKYLYEKKRKEKEIKHKTAKIAVKEIRFGPNTNEHDFEFKLKHAKTFLEEGDKVRAYVHFRGRAIVFKDRGEILLNRFSDALGEYSKIEAAPKLEGKRMYLLLGSKFNKKPIAVGAKADEVAAKLSELAVKKPRPNVAGDTRIPTDEDDDHDEDDDDIDSPEMDDDDDDEDDDNFRDDTYGLEDDSTPVADTDPSKNVSLITGEVNAPAPKANPAPAEKQGKTKAEKRGKPQKQKPSIDDALDSILPLESERNERKGGLR